MEEIHLGETGVDAGYEDVGRSRREGRVGGEEYVCDSDDHGSEDSVSNDDGADVVRKALSTLKGKVLLTLYCLVMNVFH